MFIIERKSPSQIDIVNSIGISAAAVNWHVKRLIASRIINEVRMRKYKKYQLNDNYRSQYVVKLLKNYYPGIWENWSNRLVETLLFLSKEEGDKNNNISR
jgi:hypothetical protein